jgi:hypothetical protein
METHAPSLVLYVSGNALMVFAGDACIAHRSLFDHHLPLTLEERRARVISRVRDTIQQLALSGYTRRHVTVVLASPWVNYHADQVDYARTSSFPFTPELEHTLVEDYYGRIKDHKSGELLNVYVQSHALNGYHTRDPYDQETHRVSLSVLLSFADPFMMREIESTLTLMLQPSDIYMQSHWQWMGEYFDRPESGLVCLVGPQHTDLFWISHHAAIAHAVAEYGYEDPDLSEGAFLDALLPHWYAWSHHAVLPSHVHIVYDHLAFDVQYRRIAEHDVRHLPYIGDNAQVHHLVFPDRSLSEDGM